MKTVLHSLAIGALFVTAAASARQVFDCGTPQNGKYEVTLDVADDHAGEPTDFALTLNGEKVTASEKLKIYPLEVNPQRPDYRISANLVYPNRDGSFAKYYFFFPLGHEGDLLVSGPAFCQNGVANAHVNIYRDTQEGPSPQSTAVLQKRLECVCSVP